MRIDNYIRIGDDLKIVPRSLAGAAFHGTVAAIGEGEPGARELRVVRDGEASPSSVLESKVTLSVRLGAEWVLVPLPVSLAEAEKKSVRNVANQVRRAHQHVPLFADQVIPKVIDPVQWVARDRAQCEEDLERNHAQAIAITKLRDQVEALVSADEFTLLRERRERWGTGAHYGSIFWRRQLEFITLHGHPEVVQPPVPVTTRLELPGVGYGTRLTWATAPGGAQQVRVLWVGTTTIHCQLTGEAITDYDPKLIPHRNVWLSPADLASSFPSNPKTDKDICHEERTSTSCTG